MRRLKEDLQFRNILKNFILIDELNPIRVGITNEIQYKTKIPDFIKKLFYVKYNSFIKELEYLIHETDCFLQMKQK